MFIIQFILLQVIVFSGVIFFLKKILYGDTQSAINRLNREYQDLLNKQKQLAQKVEEAEKELVLKKEEAVQVKNKMTTQAMDEIRQQKDETVMKAKQEAEEIVAKAKAAADKNYREIEKQVRAKLTENAADLLRQSISERIIKATHTELIAEFLERAKSFDLTNVDPSIQKLMVKTALPLTASEKEKIKMFVNERLGRTLELEEVEDKTLISGVVLMFGTLLMDGSMVNYIKEAELKIKQTIEKET